MDLDQIYEACKALIVPYVRGATSGEAGRAVFDVTKETPSDYYIASKGNFEVPPGRKTKEIGFAGVAKRKDSIAFHFVPVYMDPPLGEKLSPVLMKRSSGKGCFQFKTWDEELAAAVADALEKGLDCYEERGWVARG